MGFLGIQQPDKVISSSSLMNEMNVTIMPSKDEKARGKQTNCMLRTPPSKSSQTQLSDLPAIFALVATSAMRLRTTYKLSWTVEKFRRWRKIVRLFPELLRPVL